MLQLDSRWKRGSQKIQGFLDHWFQADKQFLLLTLPAESQNLTNELFGTLAGGEDLGIVRLSQSEETSVICKHLCVSNDHAENIVEIVRDPSSQTADGFHFLGLSQLGLKLLLFLHRSACAR